METFRLGDADADAEGVDRALGGEVYVKEGFGLGFRLGLRWRGRVRVGLRVRVAAAG